MKCHNCGEEIENVERDKTCPICGVLQNIVETQIDFYSDFYRQTKKLGRIDEPSRSVELTAIKENTNYIIVSNVMVNLQNILMYMSKILVIKYNIVYLVEVHCKHLWKLYLIKIFTNLIKENQVNNSNNNNNNKGNGKADTVNYNEEDYAVESNNPNKGPESRRRHKSTLNKMEMNRLINSGIYVVIQIVYESLKRYKYGITANDLYNWILSGRIPLRNLFKLLDKNVINTLYKVIGQHKVKNINTLYCNNHFVNSIHPINATHVLRNLANNSTFNPSKASAEGDENAEDYGKIKRIIVLGKNHNKLNNKSIQILCRRILNHLRIPNTVLVVVDKLVDYLVYSVNENDLEIGYPTNIHDPHTLMACAIVLITCRLLWPIFHIQPIPLNKHIRNSNSSSNSSSNSNNNGNNSNSNSNNNNTNNNNNNNQQLTTTTNNNNNNNQQLTTTTNNNNSQDNDQLKNVKSQDKVVRSGKKPKPNEELDFDNIRDFVSIFNRRNKMIKLVERNRKHISYENDRFSINPNNVLSIDDKTKELVSRMGNINRFGYLKAYLNTLIILNNLIINSSSNNNNNNNSNNSTGSNDKDDSSSGNNNSQLATTTKNNEQLTTANNVLDNVSVIRNELLTQTDLYKLLTYIFVHYKNRNLNSFLTSVLYNYTNNYFILFKIVNQTNKSWLIGSNNMKMYFNLLNYANSAHDLLKEQMTEFLGNETINLLKHSLISNNEVFYTVVNMFRNCPLYSGYSPEKLWEFECFLQFNRDQKNQTFKTFREIKSTELIKMYNNVYNTVIDNLMTYYSSPTSSNNNNSINNNNNSGSGGKEGQRNTKKKSKKRKLSKPPANKRDLYEYELGRMDRVFQHISNVTEIGYKLPPRPYNIRNQSSNELPVLYLLTLKVVSNFSGISIHNVHNLVTYLEDFLITNSEYPII